MSTAECPCICADVIYDQLKEYCGCVDVEEKDVQEMIHIVSMATGWGDDPCDTFLSGDRREVIDLPPCIECPIGFKPYYHPFDEESFTFTLVKIDGLEQTTTTLEHAYSDIEGLFRVDTGLSDCECAVTCGCTPQYKMVVDYTAGYDILPDCLLPVFCNLLEMIQAKNSCDCDDCGCENNYSEDEQKPLVEYKRGDVITVFLEQDLAKVLIEQYKNQVGMISLVKPPCPIWGVFA